MTDLRKFLQTQKFKLSNGIALGDTSIALESFNLPNGTAIASGDLGTVNYATLEPGTSNEEQISFTGFSSTTLTGVTRGLDFSAPYTAVSGNRKAHAAGAILVISNTAAFYDGFVNKNNDETIAGVHTFTAPNYPKMDSVTNDPTDDEQLTSKGYVDSVLTGGSVSKTKEVIAGTAGETVAAGEIVYFDATDKEWKLADASATGTADNVLLGIAQGAGTNGNAISGGVLLSGLDTNQTGMTAGTKQYLSDTAGALSESAGTVEVSLGTSNSGSTTDLIFAPRYDQNITEDIQDALAGSSGTPSSTNKYITADDVKDDATSGKIVRATGTALPALSGANLTNLPTQIAVVPDAQTFAAADTENNPSNSSMTLDKEFKMGVGGVIDTSFSMKKQGGAADAQARVYINGSPIGTAHNHGSTTSYSAYTDSAITVAVNDLVQLYCTSGGEGMYTKEFRILATGIQATVATLD